MADSPEEIEKRLKEAEDFLERISEFDLPPKADAAARKKWEASLDARVNLGLSLIYQDDARARDRQRAITATRALAILRNAETELVMSQIAGPLVTAVETFGNFYGLGIVKGSVQVLRNWEEIWDSKTFWFTLLMKLVVITSVNKIKGNLLAAQKIRDKWTEKARKSALPQRNDLTRHVRVKRSRKWA